MDYFQVHYLKIKNNVIIYLILIKLSHIIMIIGLIKKMKNIKL